MFLLVGVKYNKNVEVKDSFVFRKELQLKKEFKGDTLPGRGIERVTTDLAKLYKVIFDNSVMTSLEKETKLRRSLRIEQSKILPTDRVMNVFKNVTPAGKSKAKTVYYTEFTRPYEDTRTVSGKKQTTLTFYTNETAKNLKEYPDGEKILKRYQVSQKMANPKVVFRD